VALRAGLDHILIKCPAGIYVHNRVFANVLQLIMSQETTFWKTWMKIKDATK